jgi:(2Fe-2S) ferredoxin
MCISAFISPGSFYAVSWRFGGILYIGFMAKFERHIFICGNQRPAGHPRGCCDPAAKGELQKLLKQKLAERGLKGRVRANQAGCLDQCEHGPNLVVYPEAVWYGWVTAADVEEIVDSHIVGGKPVERLRMRESCINTASCEHKPRVGSV